MASFLSRVALIPFLILAVISLAAASGLKAPRRPRVRFPGAPVTFAVMGDWGNGPDGDYDATYYNDPDKLKYRQGQKAVAAAMGAKCKEVKCAFVINTGDNFYNLGIDAAQGVYDPQWKTSFKDLYNDSSLQVRSCTSTCGSPLVRYATSSTSS